MRRFVLFGLIIAVATATTIAQRSAGAAIMAIDEPDTSASAGGYAGSPQSRSASKGTASRQTSAKARPVTRTQTKPKTSQRAPAPKVVKPWDGFVVGDKYTFLNFEVVSAEKPYYTRAAKASGAKGLVQVEVLIDQNGSVLTARGRTGNKELHPEAERAALASKFNRPTFGGKPARAIGFLVYRFGEGDD
ncbi:MAG TPA: energy transducer TonB [Pyrinomonadaceae bacterium]|nr:energy transducer TonB [Pyrinomonadaceae bacterium]